MGLLSQAEGDRSMAVKSYGNLSDMANNRESANNALQQDHEANQQNMMGAAAATGLQVGMATGNPLIGLGVAGGMVVLGGLF